MSNFLKSIGVFFGKTIEFLKKNRKVSIPAGVILIIVMIFVFTRGRGQSQTAYQTEKIARGTLTATVGATGTVRARQSAVLVWQTNGTVEKVNVKVGDRVGKDDVLASLAKTSLPQSIILAEADRVGAQQALDDLLKSDTARAQAVIDLKNAQDAYDKASDYRKSLNGQIWLKKVTYIFFGGHQIPDVKYYRGYADPQTIADADNDLALKKAKLEDAQRTYDRLKDGPNPSDVAAAQARVDAAQATLNMARLIAPFGGVVTQAEPLPGDSVTTGQTAFRVDNLSGLLVDVQVSEVDINSVTLDQPVTLSFDAILGKDYHGKVVKVGQAGDNVQGVVNFTVTVQLTDADEQVKPGMTAAVNIVVNELKDVVLIPNRAVRLVDGQRVVYILKNGQPFKVVIRLGPSSDTMSALSDGNIAEGDAIVLNPPLETQFGPGNGPRFGGGG